MPNREIHYITRDFNLEKDELEREIKSIIGDKPSFVILEGVILFLSKECTDELMNLIGRIQTTGSYFGSVSYLDEINDLACFQRLVTFFEKEAMPEQKFDCLTLPTSYYENLPNYGLPKHSQRFVVFKN